jgi:hypothetical protein
MPQRLGQRPVKPLRSMHQHRKKLHREQRQPGESEKGLRRRPSCPRHVGRLRPRG